MNVCFLNERKHRNISHEYNTLRIWRRIQKPAIFSEFFISLNGKIPSTYVGLNQYLQIHGTVKFCVKLLDLVIYGKLLGIFFCLGIKSVRNWLKLASCVFQMGFSTNFIAVYGTKCSLETVWTSNYKTQYKTGCSINSFNTSHLAKEVGKMFHSCLLKTKESHPLNHVCISSSFWYGQYRTRHVGQHVYNEIELLNSPRSQIDISTIIFLWMRVVL